MGKRLDLEGSGTEGRRAREANVPFVLAGMVYSLIRTGSPEEHPGGPSGRQLNFINHHHAVR